MAIPHLILLVLSFFQDLGFVTLLFETALRGHFQKDENAVTHAYCEVESGRSLTSIIYVTGSAGPGRYL